MFPGLNIIMNSFFTNAILAEKLLKNDLTLVGTLQKCKPKILLVIKSSKQREIHSSEYSFNSNITTVSYAPKKKKAVIFLCTMHQERLQYEEKKNKSKLIFYYNKTKGGFDTIDLVVQHYTSKKAKKRWPMILWYNMIVALNVYSNFTQIKRNDSK